MDWKEGLQEVSVHWVFCQYSITHIDGDQEGFALSPAEAAVLGMPVVSTYHNGIPEHVEHGTTGLLVREWDIQGMAEAMSELARNPARAKAMGQSGRHNILSLCAPSKRSDALQTLIQSAL